MKLFKWNISDIKPKFPNVVEKMFGKKITDDISHNEEIATIPSVNIADENKAFEVSVALPGLDKKDVKIEIQNDCLIISSEKKYEKEEKNKNWMRREYGYASFQRMFQLPESADQDKVQAEMKNGVLSIKVAKKKDYIENKKQIAIQ
ncbi:Hsp20/alpha crystallin family protein [Eisenibacter elegans]|uniref:Hsp20/alpha crystallin family protein n=1 Tax=Eisenibacter elegans TaxID=997 RepID=UPI000552EA82|nr:Hsp20/alpha crystallin family protein [Eisenibacter elegans]